MASEWKEEPLERLYEFRSGLSKPRAEFGSGYPFLSFKDVFYNIFVPNHLTELVNSTEHERQRCSIRRGDVFLTRTSETMDELGMSCVALKGIENATFNGFTKRLRPRSGADVLPEYAGFFFRSPRFRREVTAMSSLSTRASLNNEMLARLTIAIPPMDEQCAIAHILGTLDGKIELNRRMNETLEAIARALFKSWFVDFDPVRAKAEGRDTGLPGHIANLFPNRFEDSELGPIPAGWSVSTVGDVGPVICGKTPSTKVSDYFGEDVPFIKIPDMQGQIFATSTKTMLSHAGAASQEKKTLPPGAICVSCIASPGLVVIATEESQTNQQINSVVPSQGGETYYWFWVFRDLGDEIRAAGSGGSVVSNLSKGRFSNLSILEATGELRRAYNLLVSPIFQRILANIEQAGALASMRDALLPKLISGEIRVKEEAIGAI